MKMNSKGFTFVEILAVIVIIGLLTGISIAAFSRYKEQAIKGDYEALAKSSYSAMEEYMMSHPYDNTVSLETLENENLLSNRKDPGSKEDCTGTVEVSKNSGSDGKLDDGTYKVNLCCVSVKKTYTYPGGKETNLTDSSKCEYVPGEEPEEPPVSDDNITCEQGNYLPINSDSCAICTSGNYCPGGTWKKNPSENKGLNPCPNGYKNSASGSYKETSCYMNVPANKYVKKAKDTSPTACPSGQLRDAHKVYYGNISLCSQKTITVTFNCNGGTSNSTEKFTSGVSGNRFSKKCNLRGNTHDGWNLPKNKNASKVDYTTTNVVTDSWIINNEPKITLYAHWSLNSYNCAAGQYLPKQEIKCVNCTKNHYCPGGKYNYNTSKDQGINNCPNGYPNSPAKSDAANDCYMNVPANKYVKKAKDTSPTACPTGQRKDAHTVNYGKVSSCNRISIEVTYDCNGGTGGGKETFYSDKTGQKFGKSCSKTGYVQDGWNLPKNKNAASRDYTVNNNVTENWIINNSPKITLYSHWNLSEIKCDAGKYLKKSATSCTQCTANHYCPGGTYKYNTTKDQGINNCPSGYGNSNAGSSKNTQCYMNVVAGKYVKNKKDTNQSSCGIGTYKEAHKVYYNSTSTCNNCPSGYRSGAGTTTQSNCVMAVTANKYVKSAKDSSATNCGAGSHKDAHLVKYGNTSSCTPYVCTVKYNANGGSFKAHTGDLSETVNYGSYLGSSSSGIRDAGVGYYNAIKTWYHPKEEEEWTDGSKVYNQTKRYLAQDLCANLKTGNRTVTLKVNWDKNRLIMHYHTNGGKLAPSPNTACPKTIGEKACKNICKTKNNEYGCQKTTSGVVYISRNPYDSTAWSTDGLRDHNGYKGATLKMTKKNKDATNYYYVGKNKAKQKIDERTKYSKAYKLAEEIGRVEELKKGNINVYLYAKWD